MAYATIVTVDQVWIPDGSGSAFLGQNQSNQPGYAAALGAGEIGGGQTLRLRVMELVPGGDSPTLANFYTALTNAASDIAGTPPAGGSPLMSQAGAWAGNPGTPLAIAQAWSTGGP